MMSTRSLAVLSLLLSAGCHRSNEHTGDPPFSMTIPTDVPDRMTVTEKNGSKYEVNGKEYYANGYKSGWDRCLYDYHQGRLDLAEEQVEVPLLGHFGIVIRGWEDGYRNCWDAIRMLNGGTKAIPATPDSQAPR